METIILFSNTSDDALFISGLFWRHWLKHTLTVRIISQTNKNIAEIEGTQKLYAEQNDINII